jgi:ligand-binding sensor domain-containing protein/two-component sensor histidine kinase
MPRTIKTIITLLAAALAAAPLARAQIKVHKTLNVEDGLVQSQVNAILEDSRGFVWFGTFGGVSRWDGREFRNFQTQDGLAALDIRAFHETSDGTILIATAENGISIYRDGTLTTFNKSNGLPGNSVRAFDLAGDGSLRIATSEGIVVFQDESFDTTSAEYLLPGRSVSGIATCSSGGYYASTFGDGVFKCRIGGVEPIDPNAELPGKVIRAIYEAPDGTLFISVYKGGIWLMKDGRFTPFRRNAELAGHEVKAIVPARDGTLYLSTLGGGIAVYRPDGAFEIIDSRNGLPNDISWWVHEGASGVVYLGTWNGVSLYRPGRFETWNAASGLPEEIVATAAESPDGTFYLGTMGGGLAEITDHVRRVYTTEDGLAHNRVWSLCEARDGTLYIGTHAGVNMLRDGRLQTVYHEPTELSGRVYAIHEATDGVIYFATYGGILTCKEGAVETLYEETDLGRSSVYSICEGRDGEIYFGTGSGVVVYRDGTIDIARTPEQFAELRVWSIHQDGDGTMYFGTNGAGLFMMRDGLSPEGRLDVLDVSNGLSDNTVYGILEGGNGLLYLTTNRGVNVVDLSGEEPSVRHMGYGDGLASDECNQGTAFMDSRARVWISTNRGVSCYDPSHDRPNKVPPKVHITRVRLYEEDLPLGSFVDGRKFAYGDNYFKFDFIGTNPPAPETVVYRYRLSRIDRDWVEAQQNLVQYTALPHGDYTFEVKARNEWGYWSEPAALRFAITPPFWKTWWFVILAVIAAGGTITLLVLNRVRHLLALEKLRTKIAADLHDDIGAGLTEISIMSDVIAQKLPQDQRGLVKAELGSISTASRQLVNGMSDIVWLVNPRRDSLHDLIARLGDAYNESLRSSKISLKVRNLESLKNVRLGMERRQHVFLIFKEAIHNAIKYSDCSEITLDVEAKGGRIEIRLVDNGKGFDPAKVSSGNGLANMKDRAWKIKARVAIESSPGSGTTVSLAMRG